MWSLQRCVGQGASKRLLRPAVLTPFSSCHVPFDDDSAFCNPCAISNQTRVSRDSKLLQVRYFSSAPPKTPIHKKKRHAYAGVRADEGRVVLVQNTRKNGSSKKPKLCNGCGTEIFFGEDVGVVSGVDAVDPERSKTSNKKARFVDAMDSQNYSRNQGAETGFLCERCRHLRSNDVWKAYDALQDVDAEVFAKQISYVVARRRFGMCILVVDATDPEHSAMKVLRKSIGKTNCWVVLNKIDLLPRLDERDIQQLRLRIERVVNTKFTNCLAVSSTLKVGIVTLATQLLENLRGCDVFVVGAANVGKTTLVQSLSSCIANSVKLVGKSYQKRRDIANNLAVTGSHLPGTTLQAVRIACFRKPGHALWDTPGVINRKAIQYNLFPTHLMEPLSRPLPIPLPDELRRGRVRPGYSILIEAGWMHKSFMDHSNDFMEQFKANHRASWDEGGKEGIDSDDDDEDPSFEHGLVQSVQPKLTYNRSEPQGPRDMLGTPTVLGRVDVIETDEDSLYVQAYLHPTLNIRVVPTSEAPDQAIIPEEYIEFVEEKMGRRIQDTTNVTRRLAAYKIPSNPNGELRPTDKDRDIKTGKIFMDLSFASLGWLTMVHANPFCIIPHCVDGSVFSKRRALYPMNLSDRIADDPHLGSLQPDDLKSEYTKQLIRRAAEKGRHQHQYNPKESDETNDYFNNDDLRSVGNKFNDADDEWF